MVCVSLHIWCRVLIRDAAEALEKITPAKVAAAMQVSEANPLVGLEGRTSLLANLGKALKATVRRVRADKGHLPVLRVDTTARWQGGVYIDTEYILFGTNGRVWACVSAGVAVQGGCE